MRLVDYYSVIDKDKPIRIIDDVSLNVLYEGGITTLYSDLDDTFMPKEVVKISSCCKTKTNTITAAINVDQNYSTLDIYIDTRTVLERYILRIIDIAYKKAIIDKINPNDLFFHFSFVKTSNKEHVWEMPIFSFGDRISALSELDDDYKSLLDAYGDSRFDREIMVTESEIVDGNLEFVKKVGRRVYNITITFNPDFGEE